RLTATFAALADPTRRAILARLAAGDASVTELARPFAISQPAVSKHLRVLQRAGLISRGRDAQRRPCRIEGKPLAQASQWLERYVRRGPDGVEMGMGGVHREIDPPERIVCTQLFDQDWTGGEAVGTLVLTEKDGKTTLTNTVRYSSREARDAVLQTPMEHGVAAGYDRLA